MMNKLFHPVTITFVVVTLIILLPFFITKETPVLTDAQLTETVHSLPPLNLCLRLMRAC